MRPFVFRLESLDALKKAERDARRAELALALAEVARCDSRRQALDAKLAAAQHQNRATRAAGLLTVESLVRGQQFESALRCELELLAQLQAAASTALDQAQEAVTSADREVQMLEKLHQRQLADYQLQQGRAEIRLLDEVAASRYQHADR
jgi:flagellar export protein FliJ